MTPKEHALMVAVLSRQAMLIKSLATILKSNNLMESDDIFAFGAWTDHEEEVDMKVMKGTARLYRDCAKALGLDAGLEIPEEPLPTDSN